MPRPRCSLHAPRAGSVVCPLYYGVGGGALEGEGKARRQGHIARGSSSRETISRIDGRDVPPPEPVATKVIVSAALPGLIEMPEPGSSVFIAAAGQRVGRGRSLLYHQAGHRRCRREQYFNGRRCSGRGWERRPHGFPDDIDDGRPFAGNTYREARAGRVQLRHESAYECDRSRTLVLRKSRSVRLETRGADRIRRNARAGGTGLERDGI